jgi:Fic family protein
MVQRMGTPLGPGRDTQKILKRFRNMRDTQYWLAHNTFLVDEVAIRLHHRLVSKIHGFPNGNGRHARMLADVIAVKYGQPEFTWGKANLGEARAQYLAALRAMDADPDNVQPLLQFARS